MKIHFIQIECVCVCGLNVTLKKSEKEKKKLINSLIVIFKQTEPIEDF